MKKNLMLKDVNSQNTPIAERITEFQRYIWQFYAQQGRSFAWRNNSNPYHIFISEVMLQQTQTHRVEKKFEQWLAVFPTFCDLASASIRDVLSVWQGLGYNRRGLYLQQSAQRVVNEFGGQLPADPAVLVTFPGIGKATAASICAFAFNAPTVFIETNIRSVFIDSFFRDQESVHDNDIMPLIAATVDPANPREWYYALMDYGVFLKKNKVNPSKKSAHYAIQSRFEGSDRQIRGEILRILTERESMAVDDFVGLTQKDPARVARIIQKLAQDGFLAVREGLVCLL